MQKRTQGGLRHAALALAALAFATGAAHAADVLSQDRRAFADGLMARGLYRLALPEYEAIRDQPPAPEDLDTVLYRLAECKRQTGDFAGAAAACERIARDFPAGKARFRAAITHALALDALGDNKRAAAIFDEIATAPEADRDLRLSAMYFAGEGKFRAGEYNDATSRFSSLTAMAAKEAPGGKSAELAGFAALYLAEIDGLAGTPEAVSAALARYAQIAEKPATPRIGAEALFKGAVLAYASRRYDDAAARFAQLAARHPDDFRVADALLPATWANFNAGRFAEALALAEKAAATAADDPAKAECAYVRASSLAGLMRRAESVAAFDELIARHPGSKFAAAARYERLVALFKEGEYARVLSDAAAFSNPPETVAPDLVWLQAESAEALKDAGRAAQFYRMLSERHPASRLAPDATYRFAAHLREGKAWLEAAKGFQKLVASYPEDRLVPYSLYASGCCLLAAGRAEEAIRDFDALAGRHAGHELLPEALLQKALAQYRLGSLPEAGATLDRLMADHPAFPRLGEAKFERARVSYELKDYPAAERLLSETLAASPSAEAAREADFLLGLVLEAQGRPAEAAAKFQPLLAAPMREKLPAARLAWLADFQFSQRRFQEAADAAGELLRRPVSAELAQSANVILARSQLALSNTNAAVGAFRAAADSPARTRYSAEAALRLGELLLDDPAQLDAAARYLAEAAARASAPGLAAVRATAYSRLAACAERRGEKEEALRLHLATSLLFDDRDLVGKSMREAARLLEEAGRDGEAAAVLEDLRERYPEEAAK